MDIKVSEFNAALEQLEVSRGISKETALSALQEAMVKGFKKDIGDDEAEVVVNIDLEKGKIDMYQIKTVVEDAEDILLEISLEDANKDGGHYKIGDEYHIHASADSLRKAIVLSIKSMLKQKFAEAEKEILYDQFKDKIGTMITGRVEQVDDKGASINIGKTSVYMFKNEMIKDEKLVVGDTIKVFVREVISDSKGARISISRACEGFLTTLMSEEIREIYDGTIKIMAAARSAGERSKVAVWSDDPNIDPAGTCIGPNGLRIQKVVSQLGNGSQKEKVDIITYSHNTALFIMEALKPAKVVGIKVDEENKSALVIVKDDSLSLAIGRKGVNARLAAKLTGYSIDIKIESEAVEAGLEYVGFEEINALELQEKAERVAEAQRAALVYQTNTTLPGVPEGYVAPQQRKYEDETNDFDSALEEVAEKEEAAPVITPVKEEKVEASAKEEVKEESPAVEEAPAKEEVKVKTTTTIEDLEKSLESSKGTSKKSQSKKKSSKKAEEEQEEVVVRNDTPRMSIYTEEELAEMEEEDLDEDTNLDEDEDIDYDEYDQYYDED